MELQNHFVILVYAFFHTISGEERDSRLKDIGKQWGLWWNRFNNETGRTPGELSPPYHKVTLERALDDTYFFLPYVRQLLFPETALLPIGDPFQQVPSLQKLLDLPLQEATSKFEPQGVIRLSYEQAYLEALHPLELEYARVNNKGDLTEHFTAPLRLDWVDIALMPQHIGFLFMKVRIEEEHTTLDRFNDLLYYVRQVHKPTIDWQLPTWKRSRKDEEIEFANRDLLDFLLQGFTETENVPDTSLHVFNDWLEKKDSVPRYSTTDRGQVYGQSFRLYSYVGLDETPRGEDAIGPSKTLDSANTLAGAQFDSEIEQVLYELATCTKTNDQEQDYMPHSRGVRQIMERGHIALWTNWEALALHDNVVFLGTRPTSFTRGALPHNVEFDYFHLYLLTLYQKIRLTMFSGELIRRSDDLYENLHEARQLWNTFTMFRNHYWYSEVTFKPQGTELYKSFQRGLNAFALYDSVNNEVRGLQEYYERRADQETAEATRTLQQGLAKNVEITRELQESTNEAVLAAKEIAHRQLALTVVMQENLEATNKLQNDMTEQLRIGSNIQIKIEWIEIFVVGFYTAELVHTIIALFEKDYHFELWWSVMLVLGSGLIAGLITWGLLKPTQHQNKSRGSG